MMLKVFKARDGGLVALSPVKQKLGESQAAIVCSDGRSSLLWGQQLSIDNSLWDL